MSKMTEAQIDHFAETMTVVLEKVFDLVPDKCGYVLVFGTAGKIDPELNNCRLVTNMERSAAAELLQHAKEGCCSEDGLVSLPREDGNGR